MDGRQFAKCMSDCGLYDKKFTTIDADIIFAKVKPKNSRKICFSEFEEALKHVAAKKGTTEDMVTKKIMSVGGPKFHGTKADFVKFHDDKSTYTGVHAKGGPK